MLDKIKKKIKELYHNGLSFFKTYLAHIVFLVFSFQLFLIFNSLPYFNLLSRYYYYVFGILWLFSLLLFKKYITNKFILISAITMFILAIPISIVEFELFNDILGFVAFLLILTYILRQIVLERENLK